MIVNEISLRIENRMTENERESENRFMGLSWENQNSKKEDLEEEDQRQDERNVIL